MGGSAPPTAAEDVRRKRQQLLSFLLRHGRIEAVFGPKPAGPVTITDVADPKLQRRFADVQQLADEIRNVRVWGGIHFRNSVDVGYDMGRKIAVVLVENTLKPSN